MKRQWRKFAFTVLMLSGCASLSSVTDNVDYAPDSQARIRLFGQNGKVTVMWRGIDCAAGEKGEKINVGGSLGDAFSSLVGTAKNHRIGIPETAMTRQLAEMNGALSKAFYKEYVLPAGKPVVLRAAYLGWPHVSAVSLDPQRFDAFAQLEDALARDRHYEKTTCRPWSFKFIPQAGKDYEVIGFLIPGIVSRVCRVAVNEVNQDGGLVPVKLQVWPPLTQSGHQNMRMLCPQDSSEKEGKQGEKRR